MQSNYKRLGDYIQLVDERNKDLEVKNLVGLTINKIFIPSVANIIGTDMSNYKIIRKNQFACSTMQVRRDKKMPLALYKNDEPAIISQAYPIFEIIDAKELLPEYLMMWFTRAEFDREACFHAVGGVRGSLEWDDFLDFKLPIPSIEKQQEIVNEYHTIQNRINLNNQLIAKLEETAQTIYKQWFVEGIDSENLPSGWRTGTLEDLYKFQYGKGNTNPDNGGIYPIYGSNGVIGGFDDYNNEDSPIIGHIGTAGSLVFAYGKHYVTYNGIICTIKDPLTKYFGYVSLLLKDLKEQVRGSTQSFISYDILNEIELTLPESTIVYNFNEKAEVIFQNIRLLIEENQKLEELKELLLGRMVRVEN